MDGTLQFPRLLPPITKGLKRCVQILSSIKKCCIEKRFHPKCLINIWVKTVAHCLRKPLLQEITIFSLIPKNYQILFQISLA